MTITRYNGQVTFPKDFYPNILATDETQRGRAATQCKLATDTHGISRNKARVVCRMPQLSLNFFRVLSVRQGKFVRSRKRKGACHVNCPLDIVAERACLGVIQGAKPREAKVRAARIEPVSASLHQLKVASLPELLKPVTDQEATGICTGRAFRGERGRRVSKDLTGTWETRRSALASATAKGKT
jgi:hypothetical protein